MTAGIAAVTSPAGDRWPAASELITQAVGTRLALQVRDLAAARRRLRAVIDAAIAVDQEIDAATTLAGPTSAGSTRSNR